MDLLTIIVLAFGLCFDSFAVSLSYGMAQCGVKKMHFFRFSLILALCQGIMPLIGWMAAIGFQHYIERYDHWLAFGLLLFLGIKMILESRKEDEKESKDCFSFNLKNTMLMGVATSIDALITGAAMAMVTLEPLKNASQWSNMLLSTGIIFSVTFLACVAGIFFGRRAGNKLGKYAEILGGIILIAIGTKVLLEHLLAA